MEAILLGVEKCMLALVAIALYAIIICIVLPKFVMIPIWKSGLGQIRGKRRVKYDRGYGIVYEPDICHRKLISQYAIFTEDDSKYLRCRIAESVDRMRYDVFSFDIRGRILDVMAVNERIKNSGYTSPLLLPVKTAYAYIVPRIVNGKKIEKKSVMRYSLISYAIFFGITVIATAALAVFMNNAISSLLSAFIRRAVPVSSLSAMLTGAICGIVISGIAALTYFSHSHKVKKLKKK